MYNSSVPTYYEIMETHGCVHGQKLCITCVTAEEFFLPFYMRRTAVWRRLTVEKERKSFEQINHKDIQNERKRNKKNRKKKKIKKSRMIVIKMRI